MSEEKTFNEGQSVESIGEGMVGKVVDIDDSKSYPVKVRFSSKTPPLPMQRYRREQLRSL